MNDSEFMVGEKIEHLEAELRKYKRALHQLVVECGHVSPFSGKEPSVAAVRQAKRFVDAYYHAKELLEVRK